MEGRRKVTNDPVLAEANKRFREVRTGKSKLQKQTPTKVRPEVLLYPDEGYKEVLE